MKIFSGIVSYVKNKYVITGVVFIVWMLFFDMKDWSLISDRREKLMDLQKSELSLNKQIAETREELDQLKSNAQTIEKYAREKYWMKKDNEDLFILKTP